MTRRGIAQAKQIIVKKATIEPDLFIEPTTYKVSSKVKQYSMESLIIGPEGNLVSEITSAYMYDRGHYITISNEENLDYDEIVRELSVRAYKVFKYIKKTLMYGSNYIILDTNTVLNIINDKYPSNASSVLRELIKADIIRKCKDSEQRRTYVINHHLFFKGSFNRFVHKYLKVYGEVEDDRRKKKENNNELMDDIDICEGCENMNND